ncbi:MAG TPA: NTP transferase domain-containing protein, partial [Beutenbergiaceae bacterium]|nr:NTP transferase domain-containing protein [Beutenbergiaceae bacterium]
MAYRSFRAIVPAGGAGTRLWPKSRRSNPKFLRDFTGEGQSLLQTTVDRLNPMADEVLVVTGDVHASAVQDQV